MENKFDPQFTLWYNKWDPWQLNPKKVLQYRPYSNVSINKLSWYSAIPTLIMFRLVGFQQIYIYEPTQYLKYEGLDDNMGPTCFKKFLRI